MLTAEQRSELERLQAPNVLSLLIHSGPGRGASVSGFECGDITRGDIADWLAEKHAEEMRMQSSTLRWAKIAGIAGIVGVMVGIAAIWLAK